MALSEKEGRLLRAIEATLVADDPDWARQFTDPRALAARAGTAAPAGGRRSVLRPRHAVWAVMIMGWVALLATGVATRSPSLTLTAIAILLWTPLACVIAASLRR